MKGACVVRPSLDAWLGRVILPAAFLVVFALTALNLAGWNHALMWLILAFLPTVGLVGGAYAIPVMSGRITIDRFGIAANVDGMRLSLAWRDVRAARIIMQDMEPYLMLGVSSGMYVLPVHLFDEQTLWEAIRQKAPEEALHAEALDHYERKDANEGISPDLWMVGTLRVADHRGLLFAAALGVGGFMVLFLIVLLTSQPGAPVYLAFSVLYLLFLISVGVTDFDPQGVTRHSILGTTRILWDELSAVEMGPFGLRIALIGMRGRRLVLFGPSMWTGPDAPRAVHFLALQISTRRLPRRRSLTVLLKSSKNTRVEVE